MRGRKVASKQDHLETNRLAYTIIRSLVDGHEALSDLLVMMSHALDEGKLRDLANTSEWENYLESKRALDLTKQQIETFTKQLGELEEK